MDEREWILRILRIAVRETTCSSKRAEAICGWCAERADFFRLPMPSREMPADEPAAGEAAASVVSWDDLKVALAGPATSQAAVPLPAVLNIVRQTARPQCRYEQSSAATGTDRRGGRQAWQHQSLHVL